MQRPLAMHHVIFIVGVVLTSVITTDAISQNSQDDAVRLLDKLIQPESESSLESRRRAYRFDAARGDGRNSQGKTLVPCQVLILG